jgi:hypothetical protein
MPKISITLFAAAVTAICFSAPASAVGVEGFKGAWISSNPQASLASKIIVSVTANSTLQVQAFIGCVPDVKCVPKTADAVAYAPPQSTNLAADATAAIVIFKVGSETVQLIMETPATGGLTVTSFGWQHAGGINAWADKIPFHH